MRLLGVGCTPAQRSTYATHSAIGILGSFHPDPMCTVNFLGDSN